MLSEKARHNIRYIQYNYNYVWKIYIEKNPESERYLCVVELTQALFSF